MQIFFIDLFIWVPQNLNSKQKCALVKIQEINSHMTAVAVIKSLALLLSHLINRALSALDGGTGAG